MANELDELKKQVAAKQAARAKAEAAQEEADEIGILRLQLENDRLTIIRVPHVEGQPARIALRAPTRIEYQRYRDQISKAATAEKRNTKVVTEVQDQLAKSVWIYPTTAEQREAMLETSPGLLPQILLEAMKLAEGRAEEEGKG
jgi:hypothetical protein